jgi:hypothetical protein
VVISLRLKVAGTHSHYFVRSQSFSHAGRLLEAWLRSSEYGTQHKR